MIDSLLNLLFRCAHRRLTRPVSPVSRPGHPHGGSYVVCLDCGKQFEYDTQRMRIGKPVAHSDQAGVVPPGQGLPLKKAAYALAAAVPAALLLGAVLNTKKKMPAAAPSPGSAAPEAPTPPAGSTAPPNRID